jgi:hypothetical protein
MFLKERLKFEMKIKINKIINKSAGEIEGAAIVTSEPISFLGGVDPKTGIVTEKGHELCGESIKNKILIFPRGKGSTVGSYVIYALKKEGNAPLAIINAEAEPIVAVGAIISDIPMFEADLEGKVKTGDAVKINAEEGEIEVIE